MLLLMHGRIVNSANYVYYLYLDTCIQPQLFMSSASHRDPTPLYEVGPGESLLYTWDDPCVQRALRWEFKGGRTKSKVIDIAKVN